MTANGCFNWIRPKTLMKTQASPDYDSVLDFIFLGGDSWLWKAESEILRRDTDDTNDDVLTDDSQTTDHRPVQALISF